VYDVWFGQRGGDSKSFSFYSKSYHTEGDFVPQNSKHSFLMFMRKGIWRVEEPVNFKILL